MQFHPLAELFPLMEGAEFDALVADIRAHGLREPVVVHEDMILDGRNRFRACEAANVEPIYQDWLLEGSPLAFVISKNLHRRHLNDEQRAIIAAKLPALKQGQNARYADSAKAPSAFTTDQAADLLNVSPFMVKDAKTVLAGGTAEEVEAVEAGDAALRTVAKQIRSKIPPEKRAKKRDESIKQVGKNPERIQRQQINAEIWGRIRDALTHLTSLPLPAEVVAIARTNDKTGLIDARLGKATQWLKDFSDAWHDQQQGAVNRDVDAGAGDRAA